MKKYLLGILLVVLVLIMACRDESLYPLPYDDRTSAHYLRIYRATTNVFEFDDLPNSAFEFVFESVDSDKGRLLDSVIFYATFRSGSTGLITNEIRVKSVAASDMGFNFVPEPTYSEYLRSAPIRITYPEIHARLITLNVDPDGTPNPSDPEYNPNCTNIYPNVCPAIAYPYGTGNIQLGDQIILRWKTVLKDERTYTVPNLHTVVSPSLGNVAEANMLSPNVTTGAFYNAPYQFTVTTRRMVNSGNINSAYIGDYRMIQVAVWSPSHTAAEYYAAMSNSVYNNLVRPFTFGNSPTDSSQVVTLSKDPAQLPTVRLLQCKYRGEDITIPLNFEGVANPGFTTAAASVGALNWLSRPFPTNPLAITNLNAWNTTIGMGMGSISNANLGTVFVPLVNTNVSCANNNERQFYLVTPLGGTFEGSPSYRFGLPHSFVPNRGYYRRDQDGTTAGQVFTIAVDDDADEYGRRNGYCYWYRRIYLRLEKLP